MKGTYKDLESELTSRNIQSEETDYEMDGKKYLAVFSHDAGINGKRPGIIVVPEWWGLNDYVKERARMLAAAGYAALAVDVFGDGETGHNPAEAMALTKPYGNDPSLCRKIVEAAIEKLKSYPEVNADNLAAIGYCFGGCVVITAGVSNAGLKAVAGFHPSLGGIVPSEGVTTKVLICHGEDDEFENDNVAPFRKRMDDAGVDYTFKTYAGSKHGFTSPKSDINGKEFGIPVAYNAAADSASWTDLMVFLKENLK